VPERPPRPDAWINDLPSHLASGFSSPGKALWLWGTGIRHFEESLNRYAKSRSHPIEQIDCRILLFALKPTEIRTVNAGIERQLFLREVPQHPQAPEIPSN